MRPITCFAVVLCLAAASLGQVINHEDVDGVDSYPQATMDAIGQLKFYFIHASVGNNIMQGLSAVRSQNAARFKLTRSGPTSGVQAPPATTVDGTVYDAGWSNAGTSAGKRSDFLNAVNLGWQMPAVDVALMKFCYLDGTAGTDVPPNSVSNIHLKAESYLALMESLEAAHTTTRFVYLTMPLLVMRLPGDPDYNASYYDTLEIINLYNDLVRAYCIEHGKLLYDIADICAWDPQGNQTTFEYHSKTLQAGYPGYYWNDPGVPMPNNGHPSETVGLRRIGRGWYAFSAVIVAGQDPVAVNDAYTSPAGQTLAQAAPGVLSNDMGSGLQAVKDTDPAHGSVSLNSDGSFTYTPAEPQYLGQDSFTYHVTDGEQSSAPATVTITLYDASNHAPVANNDTAVTDENEAIIVNVLANDSDQDSDALSVSAVTQGGHGAVTFTAANVTYTPASGWHGTDSFTYTATDGRGGYATATVSVTVQAAGGTGEATLNADYGSHERNGQNSSTGNEAAYVLNQNYQVYVHFDLSSVAFTIETAKLRLYQTSNATAPMVVSAYKNSQAWDETSATGTPAYFPTWETNILGSVTVLQTGTPAYIEITLNAATVEGMRTGSNFGFCLARSGAVNSSFINIDSDESALHPPQLVLTGVNIVVNAPPEAIGDYYTTAEDEPLNYPTPGVLENDTDADGDTLTAELVTGPTHGTVSLNPNGSFTYTPNANYDQTDSFTYRALDGQDPSAPATVTIQMTLANDAPRAGDDSYSTAYNTALAIAAPGVLANDSDIENNPLTAVKVTDPAHGAVALNADGSFTYTPSAGYSGQDSFTYEANDGTADSNTATVSIAVAAPPPAAVQQVKAFYNQSYFDGNSDVANAADDAAIATDKAALLPGQAATFANVITYSRGINGIMVDISDLPGTPTGQGDFEILYSGVANGASLTDYAASPSAYQTLLSVTARPGAGVNGSTRLTLIFDNFSVGEWGGWGSDVVNRNSRWMRVTVKATAETGLAAPYVFYFGLAIADTGNGTSNFQVTAADQGLIRTNPRTALNPAPIDFRYDINRDGAVTAADQAFARTYLTTSLNNLLKYASTAP